MNELMDRLVLELQRHIQITSRAVLVIDGDCAAGKSTLAARIAARFNCNVFHMDDFFLPPALRTEARLSEAGGNIDYDRFLEQVLKPLPDSKPFVYDAYSCQTGVSHAVSVTPKPAAVIEGSYSLHPKFLAAYRAMDAVKVFLQIPPGEQTRRIRNRSGEAALLRFLGEWIPMEKRYRRAYEKDWGDVLFIDG